MAIESLRNASQQTKVVNSSVQVSDNTDVSEKKTVRESTENTSSVRQDNPKETEQVREQDGLQLSNDTIKKALEALNEKLNKRSEAIFGIHEETGRVMIKIIDRDTREVLKEVPPEKTLDMIANVWEMAGIVVDEKR